MELEVVKYSVEENIAIIEMNNPEKLNPMDKPMADGLEAAFISAEYDPAVKVIVLKAAGRAFSGGGDVKYFNELVKTGLDLGPIGRQMIQVGHLINRMKKMRKLIICEVQGAAAGGGANLAMGADYIICADNAKFLQAFVNIGLVSDIAGTFLLSKIVGAAKALELIISGRALMADEALQIGLVYRVVQKEKIHAEAMQFANKLATGPLVSYANSKRQIYEVNYRGLIPYLENIEFPLQMEAFKTEDFAEGVGAFAEKRTPAFKGK